jgi:hypothetical protein
VLCNNVEKKKNHKENAFHFLCKNRKGERIFPSAFIQTKMAPTSKKGRVSQSSKAGIIFPVSRIHRYLKSAPATTTRVTKGASVYLAAVVEYLVGR